jgi:transaldolase
MSQQPRATRQLHDMGQSLWVDNITRAMLDSGTLQQLIAKLSVTGLTSNPTIFDHAIRNSHDYDETMRALAKQAPSDEDLFFQLALEDLRRAADLFRPVHDRTMGLDGWVSLEVSPLLAYDARHTIEQAKRLHQQADRPNVFIKIPGTPEGLQAIEECIFAGISINVTLLFSREQYVAAAEAYMRGLARRVAGGRPPDVSSVASLFISRWDKKVADTAPATLRNRLGIAVAGRAYRAYLELLASPRWLALANEGARPQRMLWASTSTKDPKASDVLYIEALASPFTINTMPDQTLLAFADHGAVQGTLAPDAADAERTLAAFAKAGIDVDKVAAELQQEGAEAFSKSWRDLLACVKQRRSAVTAGAGA